MSSQRYPLRLRNKTGATTRSSLRTASPSPTRSASVESASRTPGPRSETGERLYSDVAASRPSSPLLGKGSVHSNRVATGLEIFTKDTPPHVPINRKNNNSLFSDSESDRDDGPGLKTPLWTVVQRKRKGNDKRSLSDNDREELATKLFENRTQKLSDEQVAAVAKAAESLTKQEKEKISRRNEKVKKATHHHRDSSVSSRGEGQSQSKGKGVDPRNWGSLQLDDAEADIELQAAALKSYKEASRKENFSGANILPEVRAPTMERETPSATDMRSVKFDKHARKEKILPENYRPATQIMPNSYLGIALRRAAEADKHDNPKKTRVPSTPSSPSSSPSSESSTEHSDSGSDNNSSSSSHGSKRRKSRSKKKGKKSSKRNKSSDFRPFKPTVYNGQPVLADYHRFVREASSYIRMSKIKKNDKMFVLSHFLKDKAYQFYIQVVTINEEDWTLDQFFTELFNYCFPVDYRMKMRRKLNKTFQNEKTVHAYAYELEELFNMIGVVDERAKVIKLWEGLRSNIRRSLWRDGLNPEVSTWKEIITQAIIIEISEGEPGGENRDHRNGNNNLNLSSQRDNHNRTSRPQRRNQNQSSNPRFERRDLNQDYNVNQRAQNRRPRNDRDYRPNGNRNNLGHPNNHNHVKSEQRNTPRLSDKERAERLAQGLCFNCGGLHLARNCDERNKVKSSGSKPPGLTSHNMEFVEDDSDPMVEVLDSLPLGAISYEPLIHSQPRDWNEPAYMLPRDFIGDCYAMAAIACLEQTDDYPDNEISQFMRVKTERRFDISRKQTDLGEVYYKLTDYVSINVVEISLKDLKNPKFDLVNWYAKHLAKVIDVQHRRMYWRPIGDALGNVAALLLKDGINSYYPSTQEGLDPESRFYVHLKDYGSDKYIIEDADLYLQTEVHISMLETPSFNLVRWYNHEIRQSYNDACTNRVSEWDSNYVKRSSHTCCSWDHSIQTCSEEYSFEYSDYDPDDIYIPDSEGSIPDLQSVSNTVDSDDELDNEDQSNQSSISEPPEADYDCFDVNPGKGLDVGCMGDAYSQQLSRVLTRCQPYPCDDSHCIKPWSEVTRGLETWLHIDRLRHIDFSAIDVNIMYEPS
ncbi:hypothetical protein CVT26_008845, partial [Gymnopilus dilepis]